MRFEQTTLDNGLEVIAECNEQAYSAGFGFFVKTGSRDESDQLAGVSHFLEHMAFKGTATRSAAEVNLELDAIGSHSNAFTSEEQTVYYATVLPEYQQRAVSLLADMMRPALRVDDFETEKQVIIEEIYKYEDQPPYGAHEKCMAAFYGDHPLSRSVLGTVESVGALTADQMRDYFTRRYSPGNMVLVGAGNVDFSELVETAKRTCGSWEPVETSRGTPEVKPNLQFHSIEKGSAAQQYTVLISNAPSATDPQRYPTRLLATILGDDSGSRFYWELLETGLAEYAGIGVYEFQGAGIMMSYLSCEPELTGQNLQAIRRIHKAVESDGVTEDELELAKSKICSHIVLQSERSSSRLFSVGNGWIQRSSYRTVREAINSYREVDVDAVNAVIKAYPPSQHATVAVGPLEGFETPY